MSLHFLLSSTMAFFTDGRRDVFRDDHLRCFESLTSAGSGPEHRKQSSRRQSEVSDPFRLFMARRRYQSVQQSESNLGYQCLKCF